MTKQLQNFITYVYGFYGKEGIYAGDFENNGFTKTQIKSACTQYFLNCKNDQWGGGDSIDREKVRTLLDTSYSPIN